MRASAILAAVLLTVPTRAAGPSTAPESLEATEELDATFSYTGGAHSHGGSKVSGDVTELYSDVKFVVSPQLTRDWLLRLGADWERFDFGVPGGVPVPSRLQHLNAIVGFDYQLAEQWLIRVEFQPGIYGDLAEIRWREVDVPVIVGASYLHDADLQWIFGMLIDLRSQVPVLPAVGVHWRFEDQWTLNLVLPKPRLEFQPSDAVTCYLGLGVLLETFTVGDRLGDEHGNPKLNHAVMDFIELRAGPGLAWDIRPNFQLEIEGGVMAHREYRFFDEGVTVRSGPAPYAQIGLHARF